MSAAILDEIQRDRIVLSVAHALALANRTALAHGTEPNDSLISIAEETTDEGRRWRVNYGRRDFINRRGGDLIVVVDEGEDAVPRVVRGQ